MSGTCFHTCPGSLYLSKQTYLPRTLNMEAMTQKNRDERILSDDSNSAGNNQFARAVTQWQPEQAAQPVAQSEDPGTTQQGQH